MSLQTVMDSNQKKIMSAMEKNNKKTLHMVSEKNLLQLSA